MSRSLETEARHAGRLRLGGGALAVFSGEGSVGWYVGIGVLLAGCLIFYVLMRTAPPADEGVRRLRFTPWT